MSLTSTCRFISLILRQKPETIGITLDEHGWADANELIAGIQKTSPAFNREILEEIVRTNSKQRYSFNADDYENALREIKDSRKTVHWMVAGGVSERLQ